MNSREIDATSPHWCWLNLLLLALTNIIALGAVLYPLNNRSPIASLTAGDIAPLDILAPFDVTYQSALETQQARERAASLVQPVFTQPDVAVARAQISALRATLAYITLVRLDVYATPEQQRADLIAIDGQTFSQSALDALLSLNDTRWLAVQQEAINVLERVMRSTIRAESLEEVKHSIPAMVSLSLPESQANLVVELVRGFVRVNSTLNQEATESQRLAAAESVAPVNRSFRAGQRVVARGSVITPEDIEALQALGLLEPRTRWQEQLAAGGLILVNVAFTLIYFNRNVRPMRTFSSRVVLAALFVVFLVVARLIIPNHTLLPYLFPFAAFGISIASLFGGQMALMASLPLAMLITFGMPYILDLTLYYMISATFGVLSLGHGWRVSAFARASVASGVSGATIVLIYRLFDGTTDTVGLGSLAAAGLANGAATAVLSLAIQYFAAQFLGVAAPLQLIELQRPDHPLLQFILRHAPGTYQHSLQVANLAEQAAERIHADALLTRVAALYHDCGKANNPGFFIENQVTGSLNPHDDVTPEVSAATILQHIPDGLQLARKYKLPRRLYDFIAEHHGTTLTRYQYVRAIERAGGDESKVNSANFRYPGPRPRSRETAILMLADSSEAITRARHPQNEHELRQMIRSVIDARLNDGQLDESELTINDLNKILESFVETLKGVYHPRIEYPKLENPPTTIDKTSTTSHAIS